MAASIHKQRQEYVYLPVLCVWRAFASGRSRRLPALIADKLSGVRPSAAASLECARPESTPLSLQTIDFVFSWGRGSVAHHHLRDAMIDIIRFDSYIVHIFGGALSSSKFMVRFYHHCINTISVFVKADCDVVVK